MKSALEMSNEAWRELVEPLRKSLQDGEKFMLPGPTFASYADLDLNPPDPINPVEYEERCVLDQSVDFAERHAGFSRWNDWKLDGYESWKKALGLDEEAFDEFLFRRKHFYFADFLKKVESLSGAISSTHPVKVAMEHYKSALGRFNILESRTSYEFMEEMKLNDKQTEVFEILRRKLAIYFVDIRPDQFAVFV